MRFQGLWFKGFFCITEIFSYYSLVIWTLESYETLGSLLLSGFCGNQAVTLSYVWVSINLQATGIGFFFLPFGVWNLARNSFDIFETLEPDSIQDLDRYVRHWLAVTEIEPAID